METIEVERVCPLCQKPNVITVPVEGYDRWQRGEFVQVAFRDLSADDREGLISGAHGACFDAFFPDEDDEPEGFWGSIPEL